MTLVSAAASAISGIVAVAGWVGHHIRSLSVAPEAWACVACGVPNELGRDTCWSCGAGYGQDPLYPSPIPFERRWLCSECAVWNGIARTDCWRCGAVHETTALTAALRAGPEHPPSNIAPGTRRASGPQARLPGKAEAASRRRNS